MTLGERIQIERKKLAMSQESLADKLGVSRQAVSKWELDAAVPDLDKLVAMANYFGCTVDHLLGREEPNDGADRESGKADTGYRCGCGGENAAGPRSDGQPGWRANLNDALALARRKGYIVGYLMMFWGGLEAVVTSLIAAVWSAVTGAMTSGFNSAVNGMTGGFPGGMETMVEIDGVMVPFSQLDPALQQALSNAGISGGTPGGMMDGFDAAVNAVSAGPVAILLFLALIGLIVAIAGGIIVYRGKRRDK